MPSMTPGIEYALGAMLFFGLGDLVYKRGAAAGAQAHHFLMVQSWVFAPSVVLYAAWTGSLHFVAGSLWGALTGLFVLVGFYNFAHSLRTGSISINAPVFRLSFVLTAALAILFLGEPLTPYKVAGLLLALAREEPRHERRQAFSEPARRDLLREAPELGRELRRARVALRRLTLERLEHDPRELGWKPGDTLFRLPRPLV